MTREESAQIARLTEVVERIEEKVDDTAMRVRRLEDAQLASQVQRQWQRRLLGDGRTFLLLLTAMTAALFTVVDHLI